MKNAICWVSIFIVFINPALVNAQKASFTATIGYQTYDVKNGDVLRVCKNGSVTFTNKAVNVSTIDWRFENGTLASEKGIGPFTTSYPTAGNFLAVQTVTSFTSPADSLKIRIIVAERPANLLSSFSYTPQSIECGSSLFSFDNSSTGSSLTYRWNFGDGFISEESKPTHQFNSAIGNNATTAFSIKLNVTDINGCADSSIKNITVKRIPDASIIKGNDVIQQKIFNGLTTFSACDPLFKDGSSYKFKFKNNSSTIATNQGYTIKWGDGISPDSSFTTWNSGEIIEHDFPFGNNVMTVQVKGGKPDECTGEIKYNVFVGKNPFITIGSAAPEICEAGFAQVTIRDYKNDPPGTLYKYVVSGLIDTTIVNPNINDLVTVQMNKTSCGQQNNTWKIELFAINACGSSSQIAPVAVSQRAAAAMRFFPDQNVLCLGTDLTVSNATDFGNIISGDVANGYNCARANAVKQAWGISPAAGYTITGNPGKVENGLITEVGSQQLTIKFSAPGVYTVTLYASNERCGLDSTVRIICVQAKPKPAFLIAGNDNSRCDNDTLLISNNTVPGLCVPNRYLWQISNIDEQTCSNGKDTAFINGTSDTSAVPQIVLKQPGRYVLQLSASVNSTCFDTSTQGWEIKTLPKVAVNAVSAICINNSITPVADTASCYAARANSYAWSLPGGNPDTSNSSLPGSISYTQAGSYPLIFYARNECGTATDTATVLVTDKPLASAGKDTSLCNGDTTRLGMDTGPYQYTWLPAAGLSDANIAQPVFMSQYNKDTTVQYFLNVSGGPNCEAKDTVLVTVKRSPVLSFNPAAPEICETNSLQLTVNGAENYAWQPADYLNKTSGDTVIVKPDSAITYTVTGTLNNGCSADTGILVKVNRNARAAFELSKNKDCAGVDISSFVKLIPYEANALYEWYVDDSLIAANSTGIFPAHTLDSSGKTYVIKLVTRSDKGCRPDSMHLSFTTGKKVSPHFVKNISSGCGPLQVYFSNDSNTTDSVDYAWNFGNGITSSLPQPDTISFFNDFSAHDTTYYITLTVSNGCNNALWNDSVVVFAQPKARFGVDSTSGCSPFTATIYNRSSDRSTYYWDFGDGLTETRNNLDSFKHRYSTGAITSYPIHLRVENRCGADTQTIRILVSPNNIRPLISVDGADLSACASRTINFYNGTLGAATAVWDFGDGTDLVTTPNNQAIVPHTYQDSGLFNITVRFTNACSDTSAIKQVRIYKNPLAAFTVDSLICTGNAISPVNQSSYANNYEWQWGDSSSSPGQSPQHSYLQQGTYNIVMVARRLTNSGLACTDTAVKLVRVIDRIKPQILLSDAKPCVTYTLQATAANAENASRIEWIFFDANNSVSGNAVGAEVSHVYETPGLYKISMVITNEAGCTDSTSISQQVYATPHNVITNPVKMITCNTDTTVTFNNAVEYAGTDAVNYHWYINSELSGAENPFTYHFTIPPEISNATAFNISVVVENAAGCSDSSAYGEFIIRPVLKPVINVSPATVQYQPNYEFTFSDTVTRDTDNIYLWNFGDDKGRQSSEKVTVYRYGDTGYYSVKLLITDIVTGCKASDSVKVTILAVPGHLQVPTAICPGCAKDELRRFLPLAEGLSEYHLWIYNTWGQLVFETKSLDGSGLPNEAWDGRWQGKPGNTLLPQGTYNWRIEARFKNGTEWKGMIYKNSSFPVKSGTVTIIR